MNDKLQEALILLANKLGTSSEHIWEVINRQVMIDGIINVIAYVITILFIYFCSKYIKYCLRLEKSEEAKHDDGKILINEMACSIFCLVTLYFILNMFIGFSNTLSCFINPEYVAFNKLMIMVRSCMN